MRVLHKQLHTVDVIFLVAIGSLYENSLHSHFYLSSENCKLSVNVCVNWYSGKLNWEENMDNIYPHAVLKCWCNIFFNIFFCRYFTVNITIYITLYWSWNRIHLMRTKHLNISTRFWTLGVTITLHDKKNSWMNKGDIRDTVVARWTAGQKVEWSILRQLGAWLITKFISFARLSSAQLSLTVQNRGLKHHSFYR